MEGYSRHSTKDDLVTWLRAQLVSSCEDFERQYTLANSSRSLMKALVLLMTV